MFIPSGIGLICGPRRTVLPGDHTSLGGASSTNRTLNRSCLSDVLPRKARSLAGKTATIRLSAADQGIELVNLAGHLCWREPSDESGWIYQGVVEVLGPGPDGPRSAPA